MREKKIRPIQEGDRVIAKNPYDDGFITGEVTLAIEESKSIIVKDEETGKKYIRCREDVKIIT